MSSQDDGTSTDETFLLGIGRNDDVAPDWGDFVPPPAGCTLGGTFFADHMVGTTGSDTLCSLNGNDELEGLDGTDVLIAGAGRDRLLGGSGRDTLNSRDGLNRNDNLNGGSGRDRCIKDRREASVRSCP